MVHAQEGLYPEDWLFQPLHLVHLGSHGEQILSEGFRRARCHQTSNLQPNAGHDFPAPHQHESTIHLGHRVDCRGHGRVAAAHYPRIVIVMHDRAAHCRIDGLHANILPEHAGDSRFAGVAIQQRNLGNGLSVVAQYNTILHRQGRGHKLRLVIKGRKDGRGHASAPRRGFHYEMSGGNGPTEVDGLGRPRGPVDVRNRQEGLVILRHQDAVGIDLIDAHLLDIGKQHDVGITSRSQRADNVVDAKVARCIVTTEGVGDERWDAGLNGCADVKVHRAAP